MNPYVFSPGTKVLIMPNPSPVKAGTMAWIIKKDGPGAFYHEELTGSLVPQERYVMTMDPLGHRTDCIFSMPRKFFEPVYWRDDTSLLTLPSSLMYTRVKGET